MNHGTWNNPVTPPDVYSSYYALGGEAERGVRYTAADGKVYFVDGRNRWPRWLYAHPVDDPEWVISAQDWQTLKHHLDIGAPR